MVLYLGTGTLEVRGRVVLGANKKGQNFHHLPCRVGDILKECTAEDHKPHDGYLLINMGRLLMTVSQKRGVPCGPKGHVGIPRRLFGSRLRIMYWPLLTTLPTLREILVDSIPNKRAFEYTLHRV